MGDIAHLTTLCYLEKDGCYLMMHRISKHHDINGGKWVGVGGHFHEGETPEECLYREVKEETGLTLRSARYRGIVTFVSDEWGTEYMNLFTSDDFDDTMTEEDMNCPEGPLSWVPIRDVMDLNLWAGDRIFLKLLTEDTGFFSLKLIYQGEDLVDHKLTIYA